MRIILFPEKKEAGVGRYNGPETSVAMIAVAPKEDYVELEMALEMSRMLVYHQTRYIHNILKYATFFSTDQIENYKGDPKLIMYLNNGSILKLADDAGIDAYTTLREDIGEIRKTRRNIIETLGIEEIDHDYMYPQYRLDFMALLPGCFCALLNNRIPQRRLFQVIHEDSPDKELRTVIDEISHIIKEIKDGERELE